MNIFDLYPLPEDCIPESPNWRFDGQYYYRADGVRIGRSTSFAGWLVQLGDRTERVTTREAGGMSDLDALKLASVKWPLAMPRAACGMVIAGNNGEFTILEVRRQDGHDVVRTSVDVQEPVRWDGLGDPAAIVAGPGSPWASPNWTLQEIISSPPSEVH
jgi:hypothetical protein